MSPHAPPELTLDCRGMRCPLPIIVLARHIEEVRIGEVVELLADDPAARADVPAWCRMKGQTYDGEPERGRYRVVRTV